MTLQPEKGEITDGQYTDKLENRYSSPNFNQGACPRRMQNMDDEFHCWVQLDERGEG